MRRIDGSLVFVVALCLGVPCGRLGAQVLPTCSGTPTHRVKVQGSTNGGMSYQDGSSWIYVYPGYSVNVKARTLMSVTSGQTQGWSFGLEHYTPYWSGGVTILSATTAGTQVTTVQNGNPPDFNDTAPVAGYNGYTSGIVIDNNSVHKLNPVTNFTTSAACYRIQAPSTPGTYYLTLRFTHDIGTPKIRSVIIQNGQSNDPCADTFTFNIYVSNSVQPTPSAYCPGGGYGPMMQGGEQGGPLGPEGEEETSACFRRGNANNDSFVDLSDAVFILNYLFLGGSTPSCLDAADVNDDSTSDTSKVEITDSVFLLNHLFQGGGPIPAPTTCGPDPTLDPVGCASSICDPTDTDGDGLFNCIDLDDDNDGFTDIEETSAQGVNGFNISGEPWEANPLIPDVFVEVDWFELNDGENNHTHKPSQAGLDAVIASYAAQGITLHIDDGRFDDQFPGIEGGNKIEFTIAADEKVVVPTGQSAAIPCSYCVWFMFNKHDDDKGNFDPLREDVFHYQLWAHEQCNFPGCIMLGGGSRDTPHENTFFFNIRELPIDADGNGTVGNATDREIIEGGLFMHELGHNLGLRHGGPFSTNTEIDETDRKIECKPNYRSVMNYRYDVRGVDRNCDGVPDGSLVRPGQLSVADVLDYSHRIEICDNTTGDPPQPIDDDGDGFANNDDPECLLREATLNEASGVCGCLPRDWNGDADCVRDPLCDDESDCTPQQDCDNNCDTDVAFLHINTDSDLPEPFNMRCPNDGDDNQLQGHDDWKFLKTEGIIKGHPRKFFQLKSQGPGGVVGDCDELPPDPPNCPPDPPGGGGGGWPMTEDEPCWFELWQ